LTRRPSPHRTESCRSTQRPRSKADSDRLLRCIACGGRAEVRLAGRHVRQRPMCRVRKGYLLVDDSPALYGRGKGRAGRGVACRRPQPASHRALSNPTRPDGVFGHHRRAVVMSRGAIRVQRYWYSLTSRSTAIKFERQARARPSKLTSPRNRVASAPAVVALDDGCGGWAQPRRTNSSVSWYRHGAVIARAPGPG
jgi:hypothetical protein